MTASGTISDFFKANDWPCTFIRVVPQEATYEIQDKTFVYKIVDGKTSSTQINVYPINDGQEYIVESGLQAGDIIVAEGAGLMQDGMPVGNTTPDNN